MSPSKKPVAKVARDTDAAIDEAKRRALHHGDAVDVFTPLDAVISQEEGSSLEEFAAKEEGAVAVLVYVFAKGPHPQTVMQRLYGVARSIKPELTLNMPGRALAAIFGQGRGSESERTKLLVAATFEEAGYRCKTLPYMKGDAASASYAEAQQGNTNRRGTGKKRPLRKAGKRRPS